jgi:glutathione S-transferase
VLKGPKIPFFIRPITASIVDKLFETFVIPEMVKHFSFLESQLESSPGNGQYLCGSHLTTADILIGFPLQLARMGLDGHSVGKGQGTIKDKFPKLWAYLKRLEEEPGFKRADAKTAELEKKTGGKKN